MTGRVELMQLTDGPVIVINTPEIGNRGNDAYAEPPSARAAMSTADFEAMPTTGFDLGTGLLAALGFRYSA